MIKNVNEMGLLVNREVRVCGTSPDGIFELYENNTFEEPNFLGLCVLETTTKTRIGTATQLDEVNLSDDSNFKYCRAGTSDLKKVIEEPSYRS